MSGQQVATERPERIKGVEPPQDGKAQYITAKEVLASSGGLVEEELAVIRPWLEKTGHDRDTLMGLALSGGGIRSATFSLGVLQALAGADLLRKIDYLSTVSGGGYIGSALTWWLEKGRSTGLGPTDFPYGSDRRNDAETDDHQQRRLRHLSQHGNYLTPGAGVTLLSGIAIVLRAMFLNLAVWLPVLVALMMIVVWGSVQLHQGFPGGIAGIPPLLPDWLRIGTPQAFIFRQLLNLAVLLALLFALSCLWYSAITFLGRDQTDLSRYAQRRRFERYCSYVLSTLGVLVVAGSLPATANNLAGTAGDAAVVGPGAVLAGLASAIWSFFKSGEKLKGRLPVGVLATVGAALLIYGLLLTAYGLGVQLHGRLAGGAFWAALAGIALFAFLLGWFANINYISMHRYYRDRLMEAYLPDPETAEKNLTAAAMEADKLRMSAVGNAREGRGPYHLVNTNILLVDSGYRRWRIRGGDSFILSPLYCGSSATGWCSTDKFLGNGMTLATAMAISGAAANPNTGVGGVGLTRNPMVSVLMALLNLRLGYWAHHPWSPPVAWNRRPNQFRPGIYELTGPTGIGGLREDRPFVQLSDGGHFENLGVYELIRRRLRLIVVCDGGADLGYMFGDMQTMVRLVEEDFGATIDFSGDNDPGSLVPATDALYPLGSKMAARGYIVGDITYHDGTHGKLVYLKTTMLPTVDLTVKGYRSANPDFPDETTADQFFDEDQFEAYRELGHCLGQEMIAGLDLKSLIADLEAAAGGQVQTPAPGASKTGPLGSQG